MTTTSESLSASITEKSLAALETGRIHLITDDGSVQTFARTEEEAERLMNVRPFAVRPEDER